MPFFAALVILGSVAACGDPDDGAKVAATNGKRQCARIADTPVRLAGGTFLMGEDDVYAEEGPVRETRVRGLWINPHDEIGKASRSGRVCKQVKSTVVSSSLNNNLLITYNPK